MQIPADGMNMPISQWLATIVFLFICLVPVWVVGLKLGVKLGDRGRTFRHCAFWVVEVAMLCAPYLAHEFVLKHFWAVLCGPAFAVALSTQLGGSLREFNRFGRLDGSGLSIPTILLSWIMVTTFVFLDSVNLGEGLERDPRLLMQSITLTLVLLLDTVFASLLLWTIRKKPTTGGDTAVAAQMA